MKNKPGFWLTPFGEVPATQLNRTLYNLSSEYAQRAIETGRDNDPALAKIDHVAALGAAAELIIKSTLAGISVTLLAGSKLNHATLNEWGHRPAQIHNSGDYKATSVAANESVARLNAFLPKGQAVDDPKSLFEIRNDAIHMGIMPSDADWDTAKATLTVFIDKMLHAREHLNLSADWDHFWSADSVVIATALRDKQLKKVRAQYEALVQDARRGYVVIADLPAHSRITLINQLVAQEQMLHDHRIVHACPGCGNLTLSAFYDMNYDFDVDGDADEDGVFSGIVTVSETAELDFAACPVCRLHLDRTNAAFADIKSTIFLGTKQANDEDAQAWSDEQSRKLHEMAEYADIEPDDMDEG